MKWKDDGLFLVLYFFILAILFEQYKPFFLFIIYGIDGLNLGKYDVLFGGFYFDRRKWLEMFILFVYCEGDAWLLSSVYDTRKAFRII